MQKCILHKNKRAPSKNLFDRSLVEAVQGIALSEDLPCTVYLNFTVFRHVSIQNFQTSLNMFEEQYQITSEFLYHLLNFSVFRHVLTYLRIVSIRIILILNKIRQVLRIVSNRIKSIMTCLDMFENHIKLHHKHYDMSGHV